jgi:putative transposase
MEFRFFDPGAKTAISQGHLPHWEQVNAWYFITWRTADSIPKDVLDKWLVDRATWLTDHGIDPAVEDWQRYIETLPEDQHREFYRLFTAKWHSMLDECHGQCLLRRSELSAVVEESFLHHNLQKYELEAFVVMPNHVHVLAGIRGRGEMKKLCRNWKRFTAGRVNRILGQAGQFWQWESFDHLVRSPGSLTKFREYILKNPEKAHLRDGEYRVWTKLTSCAATGLGQESK